MFQQIKKARENESGFTLIELLVVIAILGILAGVVVFAVQGLGDKGQANACRIDRRTVATAEEAYFANTTPAKYATMDELTGTNTDGPNGTALKFLDQTSTLHTVTLSAGPPPAYSIAPVTPCNS
ncbi:MAG: type II secretion system protein [Acidimicrobiales bacterium]